MTDCTNRTHGAQLRECPFCGGEAAEMLDEFDEYREKFGDEFNEIGLGASYKAVCCSVNKGGCGAVGGWKPTETEAIAAWNARAERTCKFNIKDNLNETEGMGDVWIECSACHCVFDFYADEWLMKMNYCPNCGARVIGTEAGE